MFGCQVEGEQITASVRGQEGMGTEGPGLVGEGGGLRLWLVTMVGSLWLVASQNWGSECS